LGQEETDCPSKKEERSKHQISNSRERFSTWCKVCQDGKQKEKKKHLQNAQGFCCGKKRNDQSAFLFSFTQDTRIRAMLSLPSRLKCMCRPDTSGVVIFSSPMRIDEFARKKSKWYRILGQRRLIDDLLNR